MGELLPCPFCGGSAETDSNQSYRDITTGQLADAVAVYCTGCGAYMIRCRVDHRGSDAGDLMADLIEAWNKRTPPRIGAGITCAMAGKGGEK